MDPLGTPTLQLILLYQNNTSQCLRGGNLSPCDFHRRSGHSDY
jgi:hypothetical protein